MESIAEPGTAAVRKTFRAPQFPLTKFSPPALPGTLVVRPELRDRLTAGASRRLTVAVGTAGAGKTVLLADWAASRPPGLTSWLSCDGADDDPVRFWTGFIAAPRAIDPEFGADSAELLAMDGRMSADVVASMANDAASLPAGSAIVVDDFHFAATAAAKEMTDLVECWPFSKVQLVLASRFDPRLRLNRMRLAGELCEVRDHDMYFSLDDTRELLANFDVELPDAELALLHQRSEGWPAALQMATLSLRSTADPVRAAQAFEVRGHTIADYFIDEVLDRQPPEVARFMLDTSVLGELTGDACAALTAQQDAATLLRRIDAAHLFLVALDEERTSFRYHHLVSETLRAELRARDPVRERLLQLRSAEWFESSGDARHAARHYLAARQPRRALALLRDHGLADFLKDPADPAPLDLSAVSPSLLVDAPDDLLALATDLLLSGDIAHGGQYLDLFDGEWSPASFKPRLMSRLAVMRAFRYTLVGQMDGALGTALRARVIQEEHRLNDEFNAAVPLILLRVYPCLEILSAVKREAAAALAMPGLPEPARLVLVPGAQALALAESGYLAEAAEVADAADANARKLGFDRHLFAVDYLRALADLQLERRDLGTAEHLTEEVLRICERRWPLYEFLALLDQARIWATRGRVREALAAVESARPVLAGASSVLQARADEQEAVLRLSLGDLRTPADLASRLVPLPRRHLLLARIALAEGDHRAALEHLKVTTQDDLTPRHALEREILLAAAAIMREDPAAAGILGNALHTARRKGFLSTVVTTSPQVTEYLIEHAARLRIDPFIERLIAAALEIRAAQPAVSRSYPMIAEPLTDAEQRILRLLPTSTYAQIANSLCISRNTVKTHLRSIYQKLGVASRSEAVERAVDVNLLLARAPHQHAGNHPWVGDDFVPPLGQHLTAPGQITDEEAEMRIVVALGGNALLRSGDPLTTQVQRRNARIAAEAIAPVAAEHDVVVVHGNGPQLGRLSPQTESYPGAATYPLDVLDAGTQGMIGYLIQQELRSLLPPPHQVVTLLTMVVVDPDDPAFARPAKYVGPVYDKDTADALTRTKGWTFRRDSAAWRRVVPSPEPRQILEIQPITWLLDCGVVVLCAGGGGVPTMYPSSRLGTLVRVEVVIDKDLASELLAEEVRADLFLMATDVDGVYLHWGSPAQRRLGQVTPEELACYEFAAGSMEPKVEAATRFATKTGRRAAIGALSDIAAMAAGQAGTNVVRQKASRS